MTRFIARSLLDRLPARWTGDFLPFTGRSDPDPDQERLISGFDCVSFSTWKCGLVNGLVFPLPDKSERNARRAIRIEVRPNIMKMPTTVATIDVSGSIVSGPK
jgi:hypothetical protein